MPADSILNNLVAESRAKFRVAVSCNNGLPLMSPWGMGIGCGYDKAKSAVQMARAPIDSMTYLIFKCASTEVTKGQLKAASAALEVDLQGDKSVRGRRCRRSHDE